MIINTDIPSPFVIQEMKNIPEADSVKGYYWSGIFCHYNPKLTFAHF